MNLQVIASPHGDIVWLSGALPGAVHDKKAEWIWGVLAELEAAGLVALADKGYPGSTYAELPYRGKNKPGPQKQAQQGPCETALTWRARESAAQDKAHSPQAPLLPLARGSARQGHPRIADPRGITKMEGSIYPAIVGQMMARNFEICIDAKDPELLRPFWRAALGYVDRRTAEGATDLVDPDGPGPAVWFQVVPEAKLAKNRIHLDIQAAPGEHEQLINELTGLGGTVLADYPRFTTLADPECNELCINRP